LPKRPLLKLKQYSTYFGCSAGVVVVVVDSAGAAAASAGATASAGGASAGAAVDSAGAASVDSVVALV
jgi:hypothetical protein